jgi:tetratricopeptide (TPR) repeat protein
MPDSIEARVGQAKVQARDGQLEAARDRLKALLAEEPEHVEASLTLAEVLTRMGTPEKAAEIVQKLQQRQPPLQNPLELARLQMVLGLIAEHQPDRLPAAADAYRAAYDIVGHGDVEPTIALVRVLVTRQKAEAAAGNRKNADALGKEAETLIKPLEAAATGDAALAVTLGVAYLATGKPADAETWFRRAIVARSTDAEAYLQLGLALHAQQKDAEAVESLKKAMLLDENREDVGLQLAVLYEDLERDADAAAVYRKLLEARSPTINARARAGRFFARTGDARAAEEQGKKIAAEQPRNPAGLFLQAEGLYNAGKLEEARRLYQEASDADPTPQYLDGLGRAAEALGRSGDQRYKEMAIDAYRKATELSPRYLHPLVGRGLLHIERHEYDAALPVLEQALALKPGDGSILYNMGICHYSVRDFPRAIDILGQAVRASPKLADAHYLMGLAYFELEKLPQAAAALTSATDLAADTSPWLTEALYQLGSIQRRLRNDSAAVHAWQRYLDRSPTNQAQVIEVKRLIMGLKK